MHTYYKQAGGSIALQTMHHSRKKTLKEEKKKIRFQKLIKNYIRNIFWALKSAEDSAECTDNCWTVKAALCDRITAKVNQINFSVQWLFAQY